jgi:hypothetical protein
VGFSSSTVVMVNEAHNMLTRCPRTREVGRRLLPVAHEHGCRTLAMEALVPGFAQAANLTRDLPSPGFESYLSQPDLRALMADALSLGWSLANYEHIRVLTAADIEKATVRAAELGQPGMHFDSPENVATREDRQAQKLVEVMKRADGAPVLVWAGWRHIRKRAEMMAGCATMATRFIELSGIEPFSIDQTWTFSPTGAAEAAAIEEALTSFGGTAGYLLDEDPNAERRMNRWHDATLLSIHNDMV